MIMDGGDSYYSFVYLFILPNFVKRKQNLL